MEKQQLIHNKWADLGIILLNSQYDFDGWIEVNELEKNQLIPSKNDKEVDKMMLCRPKSLQGIEDNNGWSKMLEDGLPKTTGEYIFLCPKKIQHTVFISNPLSRAETNHFKNDFTHYKPLKTEPLPLH